MKRTAVALSALTIFACQGAPPAVATLRGGTLFPGSSITGSAGGVEWAMRGETDDVLLRIGASTVRLLDAMPDVGLHYAEEAPPPPHFVLDLASRLHARWRGTSLSVGAQVHRLDAPGDYLIDATGSLVRGPR